MKTIVGHFLILELHARYDGFVVPLHIAMYVYGNLYKFDTVTGHIFIKGQRHC